jgi:RNA polymerase-binding transcription factor DksA
MLVSRRGIHIRNYFWRDLLCKLRRHHKVRFDEEGYGYCATCGDTLPDERKS